MSRPKNEQVRKTVEQYIDDVLSQKRPAGKLERLALERHLRDLKEAKQRSLEFDWGFATQAVSWFPLLRHPRGQAAGQPFHLVPAQQCVTAILFGWRNRSTRLRRFRRALYSVARGNGKSPYAAGITSKLLCADEPLALGAECICCATTRGQAHEYVWSQVRDFIRACPSLDKRARLLRDRINFEVSGLTASLRALGADGGNADGGNLHAAVIDELHAFKNTAAHRDLLDKIETGMGKRLQDLLIYITTAGNDQSVLWRQKYDYAEKILTNVVDDDSFFAYIFAADVEDDLFDESIWIKANPLLGISVDLGTMRAMAKEARISPAKLTSFKRYKLNLLVSSILKAIDPEKWRRGNGPLPDLDGRECHGAVDLGWSNDLAAWGLVFPPQSESDAYYLKAQAWLPRDCPHDLGSEPWATFVRDGSIVITDSETTDDRAIVERILEDSKRYRIKTIAADPANARVLLNELLNEHSLPIFEFTQSHKFYHEPFRRLTETLAQRRLIHGGSPLLAWSADNVVLSTNSHGHNMPTKARSLGKIDPFVALLMAFSECLFSEQQVSIFETEGLRTV